MAAEYNEVFSGDEPCGCGISFGCKKTIYLAFTSSVTMRRHYCEVADV
jgi:hypothetical protein